MNINMKTDIENDWKTPINFPLTNKLNTSAFSAVTY
jgi:hypothetical protein